MRKNILIAIIIVLAAVAVAVPVGIHIVNNPEDDPPVVETGETTDSVLDDIPETDNSTTAPEIETEAPETDVVPETTGIETSVETEPTDPSITPVDTTEPEPVETESTVIPPAVITPVETNPPAPVVTEPPVPVETEPITTPSEPTPVVKQSADVTTGISWDGVSPIIYTYSDGTTGTEIRVGATYEALPGMVGTVSEFQMPNQEPDTDEDDGLCTHCGRTMGYGTTELVFVIGVEATTLVLIVV